MPTIDEMRNKKALAELQMVNRIVALRVGLKEAIDRGEDEAALEEAIQQSVDGLKGKPGLLQTTTKLLEMKELHSNERTSLELLIIQGICLTPTLDKLIATIVQHGTDKIKELPETLYNGGEVLYHCIETLTVKLNNQGEVLSELSVTGISNDAYNKIRSELVDAVSEYKWLAEKYTKYQEASELFSDEFKLPELPFGSIDAEITLSVYKKKGACFVATACYGDYDAPEVKNLREFRDKVLARTKAGKMFIDLYYRVGPNLARLLEEHERLRITTRRYFLQPLVKVVTIINAHR